MIRILLVEDEELERKYLKSLLEKNYEIVGEACNGKQGIELNEKLLPDIVIMDVKMPGIDGLTATKIIKQYNPRARIIIVSAYDNFNYAQQALKLGACEYLLKPAQPEEILSAIKTAIPTPLPEMIRFTEFNLNRIMQDFIACNIPMNTEKTVQVAIQKRDRKLIAAAINEYVAQLFDFAKTVSTVIIRIYELVTIISRTLLDGGIDPVKIRKFEINAFHEVSKIKAIDEVKSYGQTLQAEIIKILNLSSASSKDLATSIISYLNANQAKNITLEDIASHFHFSSCHVSRLIKKSTGLTFPEYLNQIRLSAAKNLLRNSHLSVKKIAYAVGYSEVSHFNRVFKSMLGLSPSSYRKLFADEQGTINSNPKIH